MGLKDYRSKRTFDTTPEPKPGRRQRGDRLAFVVQKHAARALHYDLRLELEGVLKSWAIPKGPSLDPAVKRLAVKVEDHPLDYQDFEGAIPEGNYGAGSVIIWDRGFYRHPADEEGRQSEPLLVEGLNKGDLKFVLEGRKLQGEFALVKTRQDDRSWLLLKKRDRYATAEEILGRDRSVLSERTLEDVSRAERTSVRRTGPDRSRLREALEDEALTSAPVKPMPHGIRPMLASLVREPFDHPDWLFEVKWDGYRAVAEIRDGRASLYSRNRISLDRKFSPIVEALGGLPFEAVLDGEIVVVDDRGHPDFQLLQDYPKSARGHLLYYVFDLLHLEGHDLMKQPLVARKELLKKILPRGPKVRFSDHIRAEGEAFFWLVKEKGLEGMIAKRAQSVYRAGRRSREWLKVKTQLTQEGVIAGFTEPRGSRRHFGALLLGVFEKGRLVFIGHTGGGFSAEKLEELRERMAPLIRKKSPFKEPPQTDRPVTWVKPVLVCEVALQGWTEEGFMRQPVFLRLREDKAAREVVREGPASTEIFPPHPGPDAV